MPTPGASIPTKKIADAMDMEKLLGAYGDVYN